MTLRSHDWTITRQSGPDDDLTAVSVLTASDWKSGSKFSILFLPDIHLDSPHCDRKLLERQMREAMDSGFPIVMPGDVHDLMQTRRDPRRSPEDMLPELQGGNYLDKVEDYAAKFFMPYRSVIAQIFEGNHDTCISKHGETNMIRRLVNNLNAGGASVLHGGYCGWLFVRFCFGGSRKWATKRIYIHHGAGGSSPVTRGVIDTARMSVWCPDADAMIMGHNHQGYIVPIARQRVTAQYQQYEDVCLHLRAPGFKNERAGIGGWAVEKNMAPTPRGGLWLDFESKPGDAHDAVVTMSARLAV